MLTLIKKHKEYYKIKSWMEMDLILFLLKWVILVIFQIEEVD